MPERLQIALQPGGRRSPDAVVFCAIWFSLLCLAASTGTAISSLRVLMETRFGAGSHAGGSFISVHVLGTVAGALWARAHFKRSEVNLRRVFLGAASISMLLNIGMLLSADLNALFLLRFFEGVTHVLAVSVLMAVGAETDMNELRGARTGRLGVGLVVGVGLGIGVGAVVSRFHLSAAFALSAALNLLALVVALFTLPPAFKTNAVHTGAPVNADPLTLAAALLVCGERFALGVTTLALPFASRGIEETGVHARTLGILMLASVLIMPVARRLASRRGALPVAHAGAVLLAVSFFVALAPQTLSRFGVLWAGCAGVAAGSLFVGCLLAVSKLPDATVRARTMGALHAAGSVGFALGTYLCGWLLASGDRSVWHPQQVVAILGGGGVVITVLLSTLPSIFSEKRVRAGEHVSATCAAKASIPWDAGGHA